MQHNLLQHRRGFTLIEAMLVLAIIAILIVSSLLFLQPTEQLAKAKNAQRTTDVNTILNGLYQYTIDHAGNIPSCVTAAVRSICITDDCSGVSDGCSLYPIVGTYIVAIPVDPSGSTGNDSNYDIQQRTDGRITILAPKAERSEHISATK